DDLRAGENLAGGGVDGDDHHDHPLLGQHLAIAQDAVADVAHDPVDVQIPGRDRVDEVQPLVGQLDHVAVLGQQDVGRRHAHLHGQAGVMGEVAELAVDGDEVLGPGDGLQRLELALHGVAGDVDVGHPRVDHFGAPAVQPVD